MCQTTLIKTKAHGCKNPDECYIDEERKIMFIIEKKFQQVGFCLRENTNM